MEHDRWHWFAGGVVLGMLVGLGIAGGYFDSATFSLAMTEVLR
jgi:hypothetical protein